MNAGGQPFERSVNADSGELSPVDRVQKSWDAFRRTAPAVTQALMMTTAASWLLNLLILPRYTLECIPHFIFQKLELYRLLTSLLVNPDLFPALFACLMLAQHCRTLEESIGSAATLWLALGVFTLLVNVLYCFEQVLWTGLFEDHDDAAASVMYWEAPGIWSALLGIVTVEACRAAPHQSQRAFCNNCFKVPIKLYPLCLLLLVVVMNSERSSITLVIATGLGYYIGLSIDTTGALAAPSYVITYVDMQFRGMNGWIGTTASIGPEAWIQEREV
jgi:membrane associated rhomboid family serine protease